MIAEIIDKRPFAAILKKNPDKARTSRKIGVLLFDHLSGPP